MRIDFKNQKPLSEEEASQKDVQFAVEQTKLELQSSILATSQSIANSEAQLAEIKTTYPLDIDNYVKVNNELIGYKEGLKMLENLQKELGFL